jgi:hypothetical protein
MSTSLGKGLKPSKRTIAATAFTTAFPSAIRQSTNFDQALALGTMLDHRQPRVKLRRRGDYLFCKTSLLLRQALGKLFALGSAFIVSHDAGSWMGLSLFPLFPVACSF